MLRWVDEEAEIPLVGVTRFLRYCRRCVDADNVAYGETYWHRCHQLAGVLVCPDHGEWLVDSSLLMRADRYESAADVIKKDVKYPSHYAKLLNARELDKATAISKRCKDMLVGAEIPWPVSGNNIVYRDAAMVRGFVDKRLQLSSRELQNAFISIFGHKLLSAMGCDIPENKFNWLRRIFQLNSKPVIASKLALVQLFLESIPVVFDAIPREPDTFGPGPWTCPNPYAEHVEIYPIKKIRIVRRNGQKIAIAECSCGYHFSFLSTSETDPHYPIVNKVILRGKTWREEATRLRSQGLSYSNVGIHLGMSASDVMYLLQRSSESWAPPQEKIHQRRAKWKILYNAVANGERVYIRKKEILRKWLSRHDQSWLLDWKKNHTKKRIGLRVDWATRDRTWSILLKAAAVRVKTAIPAKRAGRQTIAVEAGLPRSILAYDYLPLCKKVFSEELESIDQWRKRKSSFEKTE